MTLFDAAASAITVKSTTGLATAAGIWTGVIMMTGALAAVIVKQFVPMKKLTVEQHMTDMDRLTRRVTELETQVREANNNASDAKDKAHAAENAQSMVIAVVQLLMTEVEKLDPGNKILIQCREMIGAAMTGDFGMNVAIRRLSVVPDVGRKA